MMSSWWNSNPADPGTPDVPETPGAQIVHAHHGVAACEELLAQIRSDQPGSPCNEGPHGCSWSSSDTRVRPPWWSATRRDVVRKVAGRRWRTLSTHVGFREGPGSFQELNPRLGHADRQRAAWDRDNDALCQCESLDVHCILITCAIICGVYCCKTVSGEESDRRAQGRSR
jgi:hypothetical protein